MPSVSEPGTDWAPTEGGLDERILQVKGKAKQGALTRIWACMGLHTKHVHACRYYQLFFLGLAYISIGVSFFLNPEGSNTNNLQVGKYPITRDEGVEGGSFLFLSFNMYYDLDFRLNTGDHPCFI